MGTIKEKKLAQLKRKALSDWEPEYCPESIVPPSETLDTLTRRATRVSLPLILANQKTIRKTKIICTMGPKCWDQESLEKLLGAGLNIARFNFSHGEHAAHQEVLDRFRKVAADVQSSAAVLLDTKGPEIRTAMLKDHKPLELEQGQDIIVQAVGADYVNFEGYKNEKETRIGVSYDKLCQSVKPGNKMLFADGTISIEVVEILNDKELKGKVLNTKKLGERKNGNLPGVVVDIPVLTPKDIDDLQNFCCKNKMDYVAASFVQTGEDVQFIRRILDEAGGQNVQIISKIENEAGLQNFDEILKYTDGVMVARGDLGMEIPSEKVALAQKMLVTKCNIAGKFCICATQMLESMIENPLPTRAEMTDVANAVFDGCDATMLSGETANGAFPEKAVATMARIVQNAELGIDYYAQMNFIRYWNFKTGMDKMQSLCFAACKVAVEYGEDTNGDGVIDAEEGAVIVVFTATGEVSNTVSKFRPPCPVFVASADDSALLHTNSHFGQYPYRLKDAAAPLDAVLKEICDFMVKKGFAVKGKKVLVLSGTSGLYADVECKLQTVICSSTARRISMVKQQFVDFAKPMVGAAVQSQRSTKISLDIISNAITQARKTKIICTMGPKCWSEDGIAALLQAGLGIARFNFSHGTHEAHQEVLDRFRKTCARKGQELRQQMNLPCTPKWACLLDTKGPEIRTAMLRDHAGIELEQGQEIIIKAVGAEYTTWEGYKTDVETKIGLSYDKLCQSVQVGNKILIADGTISIQVLEILSDKELKGVVLNSKKLGERKNCNLPAVKVDIPVLTEKDVDDLQNFCCKNNMDFVAASFVQTGEDVKFIRKILDDAGGADVKIISKIENVAGLENIDAILKLTDGIMVARGDLGMEIPSEKVALAQKMLVTKCNIAGKFCICATQMLESMIENPLPTRAEMTDVANAIFDGADAVMLSGETANGAFPTEAVATQARIAANAEVGVDYNSLYNFIRNHTPKPLSSAEGTCDAAVKAVIDSDIKLLVVFTDSLLPASFLSKYRPPVPVVVVTNVEKVANHCHAVFGLVPFFMEKAVTNCDPVLPKVLYFAQKMGLVDVLPDGTSAVVISGRDVAMVRGHSVSNLSMKTVVIGGYELPKSVKPAYEGEYTIAFSSTRVGMDNICEECVVARKTKIVCTMGPKCWDEEKLGQLLDAGMNIARFNFSHGTHEAHLGVLERYRKVVSDKGSNAAALLDTKGPEIRTAMLKDHKPLELEQDQDIIVQAVGEDYVNFEGYKNEKETRIGVSYDKLCQSVKPGNKMLFADGTISIEVVEILNDKELKGKVLNTKKLGERKNGNLPGVVVDIPVLTPKDIDDLQNFCCKHKMDYVAASFVQSGEDVQFIRRILDEAGGQNVQIISKIENEAGLQNFDEILKYTDGVMVARGDLGMEIPSEKVALAQKMLVTKCNIAGKFCICATQMLESMIENPLPTRAEMTDVANAVFDGCDATMLSGETANGAFPEKAVATMAEITRNAEEGVNYYQRFSFIRDFTPRPMCMAEAVISGAVKNCMDTHAGMLVVLTEDGTASQFASKYRPSVPIVVVTSSEQVVRHTNSNYAQYPFQVQSLPTMNHLPSLLSEAVGYGMVLGLCKPGEEVVVVRGAGTPEADELPEVEFLVAPGVPKPFVSRRNTHKTVSLRSSFISLKHISDSHAPIRKTKIICTMGPKCWSRENLGKLLDAGLNVARFNFSHGEHAAHQEVLDRLREVAAEKSPHLAVLLDTKGPEIRTAMLKDHKPLELEQDQDIIVQAVGEDYVNFEGYKNEKETRIGVSYDKLCQSVKPGNKMLFADGTISIEVVEILNDKELKGKVLNTKKLGERKNGNLPGVKVDIPVLTSKDIHDLQNFCCKHKMDYVAVSFVQSGEDVQFVRRVLNEAGGHHVQIISKIENEAGLENFDEILKYTDGVMVARGDLGMEIPSEKVALAQKMLVTKCNIAGKFCICATQMLESMIENPLPTRAEMTDVANAVFDGCDATMLSGETANGAFPDQAVATMAAIARNAELANNSYATASFIRAFSMKPLSELESLAHALACSVLDLKPQLVICLSERGIMPVHIAKYRPRVPVLVVTSSPQVARQTNTLFALYAHVVDNLTTELAPYLEFAKTKGIYEGGDVIVISGGIEADSDNEPTMRVFNPVAIS